MAPDFLPAHRLSAVLIVITLSLLPVTADSHGPIHPQIDQVSRDIAQAPTYADLYLVRAELYRLDQDWSRAVADLLEAERLGASARSVALILAEMNLDRQLYDEALEVLIAFRRKATVDIMFAHVRAYRGLGDIDSALWWLNLCLKSPETVPADWYLLRSRLVLNRDPDALAEAIEGLDEGLHARGFDIAIALRCLDLETTLGRYDDALKRLSELEMILDRNEELLARRGDILERAGRTLEAEVAYTEALGTLEALPPARRSSPATRELEGHLRSALAGNGGQ